jgi:diguanylate cyclase (GGDEF)-like protein
MGTTAHADGVDMWRRRELSVAESEVSESEVSESEISEPAVSGPEVSGSDVSGPAVSGPEVSGPEVSEPDDVAPSAAAPRRGVARVLLALFLVAGLAAAVVAGTQSKNAAAQRSRQAFDTQASGIAAGVSQVLQRDADLTTMTRSVIEQNPNLSNAQLSSWFAASAPAGLGNVSGVTYIEKVSAADFYYFRVAIDADPASSLSAGAPFVVTPASAQLPYCLTRLLALRASLKTTGDVALPPGLDWCSTSVDSALTTSGDTGQLEVTKLLGSDEGRVLGFQGPAGSAPGNADIETLKSLDQAFGSTVVVLAPVYSGPTPTTVSGRQSALEGWVGGIFDAGAVLTGAAAGHGNLQVTLARVNAPSGPRVVATTDATNTSGGLVDAVPIYADGQWIVTVRQPLVSGSATGRTQELEVGGTILLLTLLLFLVLRSLVVSRRRALDEAAEQSGELQHMALHDVVTGLPNRSLIVDRADQMLVRSRRSQLPTAALMLGIDRFKEFNDTHGYQTGDELLQAVAERLRSVLREADTVGRMRGDEFIVLIDGASLAAGPELVAERILEVLREPFHLGENHLEPYTASASVGIALGPRVDAEHLLQDAGTALSQAKQSGRGGFAVFGQDMPQAIESRQAFENELRSAVATDQFFLRYQPIFDIDTRRTTGVEALLRWQHPTRRVVPPDHFLPMLEESGLIIPLGRWVLQEACRQGAALHRSGYLITMSVNMSARQLESDSLLTDVGDALIASGFEPNALVLEITETTIMRDTSLMVDRLIALKGLGVRIAIDDFGTGYSSLAYLRQFPIDILKIDRSFISSLATTRDSSMLIHTLVQFGKTLGLETIAEGIEEEGQMDPLLAEQCDTGQGFLYGRPLSPTQLDIFLRTHLTRDAPLWVVPPKQPAR